MRFARVVFFVVPFELKYKIENRKYVAGHNDLSVSAGS